MALSKDQILGAQDAQTIETNVPEWGGTVYIRVMSGTDRDAWEAAIADENGKVDMRQLRAKLLVRTLADEKGNRLFTDAELEALSAKNGNVIMRLYDVATKLNAISKSDEDELLKN